MNTTGWMRFSRNNWHMFLNSDDMYDQQMVASIKLRVFRPVAHGGKEFEGLIFETRNSSFFKNGFNSEVVSREYDSNIDVLKLKLNLRLKDLGYNVKL